MKNAANMENNMELPQKMLSRITNELNSGYLAKKIEICISERYYHYHSHVYCKAIHKSEDVETT